MVEFKGQKYEIFVVFNSRGLNVGQVDLLQSFQREHFWCLSTFRTRNIHIYYINTSEIPSELSRGNFISSHVKITCYISSVAAAHTCYDRYSLSSKYYEPASAHLIDIPFS